VIVDLSQAIGYQEFYSEKILRRYLNGSMRRFIGQGPIILSSSISKKRITFSRKRG